MGSFKSVALALSLTLLCDMGLASQARNYGLGGSTSGRVSAVIAEEENAYSAAYNPALLSVPQSTLFGFSTSVAHVDYSSELRSLHQTLWTLGYVYPFHFSLLSRRLGLGIALSGPYDKVHGFVYAPEDAYSLRYGNSDVQLKATLGLSFELLPNTLSLGSSISFFLSGAGNAEATINSSNPSGRMAMDAGLNTAWVSGAYFHSGRTSLAFVYLQEISPELIQRFEGKVSLAGNSTFRLPIIAKSFLYYEPQAFELEGQYDLGPFAASLGVSYQMWSGYHPPILIAETTDGGSTYVTTLPTFKMKNTWNPRASVKIPFSNHAYSLSAGYQFRPSPIEDGGTGNALDSDTHVWGLSIERRFSPTGLFPFRSSLGLFGQYHRLVERQVSMGAQAKAFSADAYAYGISLTVQ